jgi:ATP-dependent Lon protease
MRVADPERPREPDLDIPDLLAVLPIGDTVVYPFALVPVVVGQERSLRLVDEVMRTTRVLCAVAPRRPGPAPGRADLHAVGTAAAIQRMLRAPDGSVHLVLQGLERLRLRQFVVEEPFLLARVERYPEQGADAEEAQVLARALLDLFKRLIPLVEELPGELAAVAEAMPDPQHVAYLVATHAPLDQAVRQEILELDPVAAKCRRLIELLQHELGVRQMARQILDQTREHVSRQQRELFLREQLRTIQKELGEDEGSPVVADLRRRLADLPLPPAAREEADRELDRLVALPTASPEHSLVRTYLEWLASLPWAHPERPPIDVARARQVLDEDHYGLAPVKERILEHLAVLRLRHEQRDREAAGDTPPPEAPGDGAAGGMAPPLPAAGAAPPQGMAPDGAADAGTAGSGAAGEAPPAAALPNAAPTPTRAGEWHEPILCFLGPPGVGKTSLGQSIARALGREFVRVSLGGVHDEAEIRGHRRTYVGAMPGRIIQALRRARTSDPVLMLDEIDKLGVGLQGSPAAALLEVLDPAQNHAFVDNYLGVPFDLSAVLFLCTANTTEGVLPALLDRVEILELPGYADEEKVEIARRYLIPRAVQAHALPSTPAFEDAAIQRILRDYTREPGVRQLDRELATVVRKLAFDAVQGKPVPAQVGPDDIRRLLGRPRYFDEVAERLDRPGVATGLAWTPAGGDVLFVEATIMPSQEEHLILTGMLGDVMRESAMAALSFLRSQAGPLGLDPGAFTGRTVHVHVPAGAVPKDGPSAGVTILTALASLVRGQVVRSDLAMTGEITLRGKVLPVGGIKEKLLAAHRAGLRAVLVPRRNAAEAAELPEGVRQSLEVIPVDTADQVLQHALGERPGALAAAALPSAGNEGS